MRLQQGHQLACPPRRPGASQACTGLCGLPRQGLAHGCLAQWDVSHLAGPGPKPTPGATLLPSHHCWLWPPGDPRPLRFTGVTRGWHRTSPGHSLRPFSFLG